MDPGSFAVAEERNRVPSRKDSVLTTGRVFLTAFRVAYIRAQPVVAQSQGNAPGGAIVPHLLLYAQHNHLQEATIHARKNFLERTAKA
ncbi:hypothetical protein GB937_000797 [Aspergillus fischeri]|nr:hypothetical protein GB937_000797 [Aspergillus fischeri]